MSSTFPLHIQTSIATELALFEQKFSEALKSKTPLLDVVMRYIIKRKGKQIRPMFVFHTAKMLGGITESTYTAASMIELLHTASLVHDDVVDDANMRRGFFSINALWKNKIAVLVGDYLLAKGLLLSINKNEIEILRIVSEAVREMSEGELLQMEKTRRLNIDEAVYYEIIRQKTATLIASACATGAASAGSNAATIEKARQMGEWIGMAFQIKDDLMDFGSDDIGKPRGIDIKEKKLTLPVIYTLNKVERRIRNRIINIIKHENDDPSKVSLVLAYVRDHGGLDYATLKMNEFKDKALKTLSDFDTSESNEALKSLITYTIERKK